MKKAYLLAGLGVGILAIAGVSAAYATSGNYSAWKAAMGDNKGRAASVVTEKNFDQFAQMHQLMADGKYEEAQKVRTELGLGQGRGGKSGGCGMHNGTKGQGGGCGMHSNGTGTGTGANFSDANNNGVCDHAE
jgi:hypothetical protein